MRPIRGLAALFAIAVGIVALPAAAPAAVGDELLLNPGLEAAGGAAGPAYWTTSTWGTNTTTFSWPADAHSGAHSVRVAISAYTDGDSKWVPDDDSLVAVTGGRYYRFSDWYKSDASTAVSVYYETATDPPGEGHWANLFSGIAPVSSWTRYRTGFTMPAGAVRAYFAHFIARRGFLQTDDYSMTEAASPPGFSRPMVSLTFDDGSEAFRGRALPMLDAKGFKTTQYIPTQGLTAPLDPFMMTPDEVKGLAAAGHEIGSHSVTHPDLTTLSDTMLAAELQDSRTLLEAIVGAGKVRSIAYPFGVYDARVIAAAQAAGYRSARSVEEGYNSPGDLEPYNLRGQNMTSTTTMPTFASWVDYAKAHRYWLVIIYHEIVPDHAPVCTDPETVDPCLGPYDTTESLFQAQLDYLTTAGLGGDVMTVDQAQDLADAGARPTAGTVGIGPASPTTGDTVTATPTGFSDPDGDPLTYRYRWLVGGRPVAGATTATLNLAQAGHGDRGETVTVQVSADDGHGHSSPEVGATVTVGAAAPTLGVVGLEPSSPTAGVTLTATPGGFDDADGDELSYAYAWYRNGVLIPDETSPRLTAAGAAGDVLRVDARADDGHGGLSEAATASVVLTASPSGAAGGRPAADRTAPRIRIASPTARSYALGARLTIRFTCTDASGRVQTKVTIRRLGGAARKVRQGQRIRLTRTGTYEVRVTATDRAGNRATRTIRFRVRRKR
jgi:peptidoglycan/xylan/chitin deacetylase (PgdA/CDA1 family)